MSGIFIRDANLVTMESAEAARGGVVMNQLPTVPHADVLISDGLIQSIQTGTTRNGEPPADVQIIRAAGRVLMPAFVDCHTHACWAGDRLDEWERRQRGDSYLDVLKAGGGILSTVAAVRASSEQQLTELLVPRLRVMLRHGTTAVEIKSGYGLDTEHELKMLRAIHRAAEDWPGRAVATACLGHAIDPSIDRYKFIQRTINETLPAVSSEFPGIAVDAYCEEGAWSLEECLRLFHAAQSAGHPVRVHADQFHSLGMIPAAIERDFVSVDHLEASREEELIQLAASRTWGVMLPASGFHVDGRYGDGRRFLDAGGRLAIATNWNPGSAPCASLPMVVALACRNCGLTAAEAIAACTVHGASLLGLHEVGTVRAGQRADLILLRHHDPRQLAFEYGGNPVDLVICRGELV